ncbi:MAG: 2-amino-4-hydroxy-6-hydroxymethyldihydropteridine diphosphokinase [Candidatus Amulumruptor caecigallinarius]|nr:2-amino-4-hydroxy-6-hydroxymethyldihydropteridine diphosphokinase [Candidatus Amulumruptor caecigallinarius]MCM1396198.1 2-amino-4-hydroxy-6-hydroxymethyldihydropteridine diphosphokinase [Candidatus Amulumruptor caecigallinarius]MCM1453802.1 2-amino-4-hydroxy-6-hydroxymethyldihydropteridine diphosphokinase [bacterium]
MLIGLGSRDGRREQNVKQAITWLRSLLTEPVDSGIYMTAPLSGVGSDYCNAVVTGIYAGEPETLAKELKAYERSAGRTPARVTIDLDLVGVDGQVMRPKDYAAPYFTIGLGMLGNS